MIKSLLCLTLIFTSTSLATERIEQVIINGDSMMPLLKNKQEVRVDLNYYEENSVQHLDVVVFEIPGRKNRIVKRVYGIPGDRYEYKNSHLYINKKILKNSSGEEFKISSKMLTLFAESYPIIPAESYLVLGDRPTGTFDASQMGFIDKKQILGKVLF